MIDGLKAELPAYLAAAEDVSTEIEPVAWWKSHSTELPKWADAFRYIVLVQPSSAAAERVFSILQGFTAQQQSSWRTISNYQSCYSTTVVPFFIMTQLFSVLVCTQTFLMEISTRKLRTIKSKIGTNIEQKRKAK